METVLLNAGILKRFIVIRPARLASYVRGNDNGTIVTVNEPSVFSPLVKIEVERSTQYPDKYVHLRFSHFNKYWGRGPGEGISQVPVVAESNEPEEDITKLSSTLFEPVRVRNDPTNTLFNLIHVQSGGYLFDVTSRLYLRLPIPSPVTIDYATDLTSVNWVEIVKLPNRIAFVGHNDKYLGGYVRSRINYLHLSFPDGKAKESIHEVHLMNDGHIRIKSIYFDRFWRRNNSNWIVADATNTTASVRDRDTLFWPVHNQNEGDAIALRNAGNNMFCTFDRDYLIASSRTMTDQAKLTVEELVLGRRIYNVRYRVDNSRVFNQAPFLAGTTTAENNGNTEASIAVEVTYEESRSESFTRSVSLSGGVTMKFEAGVPLIGKTGFEFTLQSTMTKEWNNTTTTTITVKATGSVPVPPRTLASVSYVGTKGTCDVPFNYTQEDQSSTDGRITETEHIDGVFTGVNAYDFSFFITGTRSLPLSDEVLLPAAIESGDSEPQ